MVQLRKPALPQTLMNQVRIRLWSSYPRIEGHFRTMQKPGLDRFIECPRFQVGFAWQDQISHTADRQKCMPKAIVNCDLILWPMSNRDPVQSCLEPEY